METKVKFKHKRFSIIQAVYGDLEEDASLVAVEECEKRLDELFKEIDEAAKDNHDFTDSMALEMCVDKAQTMEELIIFVHKVSAQSACPTHPFLQMIGIQPRKGGGKE